VLLARSNALSMGSPELWEIDDKDRIYYVLRFFRVIPSIVGGAYVMTSFIISVSDIPWFEAGYHYYTEYPLI